MELAPLVSIIGYARVSTDDQTTDNQVKAIGKRYKVDKWFVEDAIAGAVEAPQRPFIAALMDSLGKVIR